MPIDQHCLTSPPSRDSSYQDMQKTFLQARVLEPLVSRSRDHLHGLLTPPRWGLISCTCLWGGRFQRYPKSFRISHKPFYGQVSDKRVVKKHKRSLITSRCKDMPESVDCIDDWTAESDIISYQRVNYISTLFLLSFA